jgi:FkbM family methyltransferase
MPIGSFLLSKRGHVAGLAVAVLVPFTLIFVPQRILAGREWPIPKAYLMKLMGRAADCDLREAILVTTADRDHLRSTEATARNQWCIRRDGKFGLWKNKWGAFWISSADRPYGFAEIVSEQDAEPYDAPGFGVRPGDIVLDCGANYGIYTRRALDFGASLVVAIEPVPDSVACLRRTFENEIRAGRVIVYPKGVWDRDDHLIMYQGESWDSSFVDHQFRGGKTVKLPLTTIDKMVEELGLPRVDYVKMDIEGAEPKALAGAVETLRRFRPGLGISVYHEDGDDEAVTRIATSAVRNYKTQAQRKVWFGRIRADVRYFY